MNRLLGLRMESRCKVAVLSEWNRKYRFAGRKASLVCFQ